MQTPKKVLILLALAGMLPQLKRYSAIQPGFYEGLVTHLLQKLLNFNKPILNGCEDLSDLLSVTKRLDHCSHPRSLTRSLETDTYGT